jgi:caffeoyl-CoA O-methyltransferase
MKFLDEKIERYAAEHTEAETPLLRELDAETQRTLEYPQMLCGQIEGRLLKLLAGLLRAETIIEIGAFSGYSALSMAEALPEHGRVFTLDNDPACCAVARKYFARSPHGKKIILLEGEALESLKTLSGPFDMAFIDADKVNYPNYYEAILPKMRAGGLIVADNVLWSGRVLNPVDATDKAIHAFNEWVVRDARVEAVMLPVRDGIYCIRKK